MPPLIPASIPLSIHTPTPIPTPLPAPIFLPSFSLQSPTARRSSRSDRESQKMCYYIDELFLATVTDGDTFFTVVNLVYQAELETDFDSGEVQCTDHQVYAAKFKIYDEDNPSYHMAMTGEHSL